MNCDICGRNFNSPYKNQVTCSEPCRVRKEQIRQRKISMSEYDDEKRREYAEKVKKFDKNVYTWMDEFRPTKLPGGDFSIFGDPTERFYSFKKKGTK